MRCLAVRQPWAWALVAGAKDIENRSWSTDYRGPIIIQVSSTKSEVNRWIKAGDATLSDTVFTYSALIGVVDVIDVVPLQQDLEHNPWASGPYCWRVANARVFKEPITAKGKLSLYNLDAALESRARNAMSTASQAEIDAGGRAWIEALTRIDDQVGREEMLFDAYLDLGDVSSAGRLAERAVRERGTAGAYLLRAVLAYEVGNLNAALDDANKASELDAADERVVDLRKAILDEFSGAAEQRA